MLRLVCLFWFSCILHPRLELFKEDFPLNTVEWNTPFDHIIKFLQVIPEGKSAVNLNEMQES